MLPMLSIVGAHAQVQQGSANLTQISTGWCSPNIANVVGNVTIICEGLPPAATAKLNAQLRQAKLSTAAALRDANRWREAYKNLEAVLLQLAPGSARAREAQEYLQRGEVEKVTALLGQLLDEALKSGDGSQLSDSAKARIAAEEYALGLAIQLQSQGVQAIPHFERAYKLRPGEWKYGEAYAAALLERENWVEAEPVLLAALKAAKADAATHPEERAATLNTLAVLYSNTGRIGPAEESFQAALELERGPARNRAGEAQTLNNLAILYRRAERLTKAEEALQQALQLFRSMAASQPSVYEPYVAGTLDNLGSLYTDTQQMSKAEAYYKLALELDERLARGNPAVYGEMLGTTQANLAEFYRKAGRSREAEASYTAARSSFELLAKKDPATYQSFLIRLDGNEANFYTGTQQFAKAEELGRGALSSVRELVDSNPPVYKPLLAVTLQWMAILYSHTHRPAQAEEAFREAMGIRRPFAEGNPAGELDLARLLNSRGNFYRGEQRMPEAETDYKESLELYQRVLGNDPSAFPQERAYTLYNLAEIYQRIPKLADAEAPYQQALTFFRQMARDEPSVYLEYVSRTLCGLGLLHYKLQQMGTSQQEVAEAIRIDRGRVQAGYPGAANGLASSLVYAAMMATTPAQRCQDAQEAARLATDPEVRTTSQQLVAACP